MRQDEVSGAMKVELLASLKDDSSTKLRKLDFHEFKKQKQQQQQNTADSHSSLLNAAVLESVAMLGSEGGKILPRSWCVIFFWIRSSVI